MRDLIRAFCVRSLLVTFLAMPRYPMCLPTAEKNGCTETSRARVFSRFECDSPGSSQNLVRGNERLYVAQGCLLTFLIHKGGDVAMFHFLSRSTEKCTQCVIEKGKLSQGVDFVEAIGRLFNKEHIPVSAQKMFFGKTSVWLVAGGAIFFVYCFSVFRCLQCYKFR